MPYTREDCKEVAQGTCINKSAWRARAQRLADFCNKHTVTPEKVTIVTNNTWSAPPAAYTKYPHTLLGGTTYQYQVWAVKYA